jgi:hypothetical protein
MEKKRTTPDELTLSEFKAARALAAKEANRKHRRLVKEKLSAVNNVKDEKIDEMLDLLRKIEKRMDATEDTDTESESDSEDEPEQVMKSKKSKKLKKLESDSEEEEPVLKKKKKRVKPVAEPDSEEEPAQVKKKKKVKQVKPDVFEPNVSDDLQLQRKFPLLYNYPTYV